MTTMQWIYLMALIDAAMGAGVFFICFCRVVATSGKVLKRVRLKFALLGPAALAFGLSPLWGDYPGWVNPLFLGAVLVGLLAETYQWRRGAPPETRVDTMPADLRKEIE